MLEEQPLQRSDRAAVCIQRLISRFTARQSRPEQCSRRPGIGQVLLRNGHGHGDADDHGGEEEACDVLVVRPPEGVGERLGVASERRVGTEYREAWIDSGEFLVFLQGW